MYYRVAIQAANDSCLKWKSTALASLEALFRLLRLYRAIPQDSLRVFNASSREELNAMLAQENDGLVTNSVSAGQFLRERGMSSAGLRQEGAAERTPAPRRTRTGTLPPLAPLPQGRVQEPVLKEQSVSTLERRRLELEMGPGGDHDQPYTFTLPVLVPQLLTWTRLMVRVQQGELQP
jgi:hypothetical protein